MLQFSQLDPYAYYIFSFGEILHIAKVYWLPDISLENAAVESKWVTSEVATSTNYRDRGHSLACLRN